MQAGLGLKFRRATRLVSICFSCLLIVVFSCFSTNAWSDDELVQNFSANVLKVGCSVSIVKVPHVLNNDPLSAPPYDIKMNWSCANGSSSVVDKYDIEGSSPEVVTLFFRKRQAQIVALVKWSYGDSVSNFNGDFYKIYIYEMNYKKDALERRLDVMNKLGDGWDGVKDGRRVYFKLQDASSIRTKLDSMGC